VKDKISRSTLNNSDMIFNYLILQSQFQRLIRIISLSAKYPGQFFQ